jgi:DNA-binding MarR family transcriptional regulator
MTIVLLDKAGYDPTLPDLVAITGLPRFTVSRYLSRQIDSGFLTDVPDPRDRRSRYYRPTSKGKKEAERHEKRTLEIASLISETLLGAGNSRDTVSDLKKVLLGVNGQLTLDDALNYKLEVTKEEHYVYVKFEGDLTAENEEQVINDIYSTVVRSGKKNALVDRQAGQLEASLSSNYEEAKFISELPDVHRYRFAVLFRQEDIGRASLLEAVAANRGVNWKFFEKENDAIKWLTRPAPT